MAGSDQFVHLSGGFVLPVKPYRLALELEARGFTLTAEDDGQVLVVTPSHLLTPDDCARISRWKWHLSVARDVV